MSEEQKAMQEAAPKAAAIFGAVEDEKTFEVRLPNGTVYLATFASNDLETITRYRQLYSGGIRQKQGSPVKAMRFIFERKFKRTNIAWDDFLTSANFDDEKEFFLNDPRGKMHVDAMVDGYLGDRVEVSDPND